MSGPDRPPADARPPLPAADAVVVAAGSGSRFGEGDTPKQFLPLLGLPVVVHAVRALFASGAVARLALMLPAERFDDWRTRLTPWFARSQAPVRFAPGGATRQASVTRGLEALEVWCGEEDEAPAELVAVHDGARPAPPPALVREVVEAARRHGAAIPGLPPPDTLWRVETDGAPFADGLVDREATVAAQTPQCFRRELLDEALRCAAAAGQAGTDEASVVRSLGHPVRVVPGSPQNLKVTRPEDLECVRALLGGPEALPAGPPRLGFGFDAHRFGTEGVLRLGGLDFPEVPALEGHSDGDALLHALADAILGAAAAPDLGALFPSSDPALAGAASERFVARALELAAEAGYRPGQVDVTVIAERPRLAPRIGDLRERLGALLGIPPGAVGLKATTTDGMGFTGRGEGLAVQALVRLDALPPVAPAGESPA